MGGDTDEVKKREFKQPKCRIGRVQKAKKKAKKEQASASEPNEEELEQVEQQEQKQDDEVSDTESVIVMYDDDGTEVDLDELLKESSEPTLAASVHHLSIAFIFHKKYDAMEDTDDTPWDGHDGIILKIKKDLGLDKNATGLRDIMEDFLECKRRGVHYTGERRNIAPQGRLPQIMTDSIEAQIVADGIEGGLGQTLTWNNVNSHWEEEGLLLLTFSAVREAIE